MTVATSNVQLEAIKCSDPFTEAPVKQVLCQSVLAIEAIAL